MEEEKQNMASTIYQDLKKQIVELTLPPGTILLERMLALSLGTSRTPVREALKRLAQDGWIVWEERRRAVVRDISLKDVHEVFMLREMVETFAIRMVFATGEPRLVAGMLVPLINSMKKNIGDPLVFNQEDMKFHTLIIEHLENDRLNEVWSKIRDEITRIAIYSIHERRRPESVIVEHEALIDGFWERNCERTVTSMVEHFQKIQEAYSEKFSEQTETL
jgi:DNA-binding GntR family transcriptional regulator